MADRVFIVTDDAMRGPLVPDDMVHDLSVIAEIPTDQLQLVADALAQAEGFLFEEQMAELVSDCLQEEAQASAVVNAIQNVPPHRVERFLETLDAWHASPKNAERLSVEAMLAVRQKIPQLIGDYPSTERSRKARRLVAMTGNIVEGLEILCDARPVYNNSRDSVEGLIPTVTLKLVFERQNDQTDVVELMLTSEQLDNLIEKSEKAKQKLTVLRESIARWIPNGLADIS